VCDLSTPHIAYICLVPEFDPLFVSSELMAKYQLNFLAFVAAAVSVVGLLLLLVAAVTVTFVMAVDADPIDDFCVADLTSPIILNGLVCVNPATVNGSTFAFTGFENAGNTSSNGLGSAVTPGFAGVNYPAPKTYYLLYEQQHTGIGFGTSGLCTRRSSSSSHTPKSH
jgi:hypothetical protein